MIRGASRLVRPRRPCPGGARQRSDSVASALLELGDASAKDASVGPRAFQSLSPEARQAVVQSRAYEALSPAVFEELDRNKDGFVSMAEFERWLASIATAQQAAATPPTASQLWKLGIRAGFPFIGFGFVDNFVMITAGDLIEVSLWSTFHISTMAAAGLGNLVSDVMGLGLGGVIEAWANQLGLPQPGLSEAQLQTREAKVVNALSSGLGVAVGCFLGMVPLLFIDTDHTELVKAAEAAATAAEAAAAASGAAAPGASG